MVSNLQADLRFALRRFAGRPWSTLSMVVMLAIGIGASTAVFSLMSEVLLHPMGLKHPDRVMTLSRKLEVRTPTGGWFLLSDPMPPSREETRLERQDNTALQGVADVHLKSCTVRAGNQDLRRVTASFVTREYFQVLDVHLALGRGFSEAEEAAGEPVAILGYGLWKHFFEGDRSALGAGILVNGRSFRVVGIAPQGFSGYRSGFSGSELWCPRASADFAGGNRMLDSFDVVARLKPGATLAQARAALQVVASRLPFVPDHEFRKGPLELNPLDINRSSLLAARLPSPWLLLGVSSLLLLLGCANAGNLRLAELEARRQEFATRLAMGAMRKDLVKQVLGESLLLAVLSGALGLWMSGPMMALLSHARDVKIYEQPLDPVLNGPALLLALGLMVLSALLVGLPAAIQASRANLSDVLKEGSSRITRGSRFQDVLMVLQVALALSLVACGLLVSRGLDRAQRLNLGFKTAGIAALRLEFPPGMAGVGEREPKKALMRRLRERVAALPGVEAACLTGSMPLEDSEHSSTSNEGAAMRFVGPGYFRMMGIPLVAGRDVDEADLESGAKVQWVTRAYAQRAWPGEDPLGKEGGVVGVVEDHAVTPEGGLHPAVVFHPTDSMPFGTTLCLLIRTHGKPEALFPALRRIVSEVDGGMPIVCLIALDEHVGALHHHLRVAAGLLGFCALVALLLAVMGVQSLMAFRVSRQTREISLRMALGAQRRAILVQVLWKGMSRVLVGLVVGCLGAYVLGRVFHRLLGGVEPLDPQSLVMAVLLILSASLLACLFPALRAASVDPVKGMRED